MIHAVPALIKNRYYHEKVLQILAFCPLFCYDDQVVKEAAPAVLEHPGARTKEAESLIEKSLARPARESTTLNYTKILREAKAALQRTDHDMQLSRRRPEPLATELRIYAYQEIGCVKVLLQEAQRAIRTEQAAAEEA